MSKPFQIKCKRGHVLENNRYVVETIHKKTGVESGCRLCKNMRNKLQSIRTELNAVGKPDQIPTLNEFAKDYFKNHG